MDGTQSNVQFTQEAYEDMSHEHLEELNRCDEYTKSLRILPTILQELHDTVGRLVVHRLLYFSCSKFESDCTLRWIHLNSVSTSTYHHTESILF